MITIYDMDTEDFSGAGLCVLDPIECTVTWEAAGQYDLELVHPIDDAGKWRYIERERFIQCVVPVRESPIYTFKEGAAQSQSGTVNVTRNKWVVSGTSTGLYLRTGAGTNYPNLGYYKNGTEVIEVNRTTVSGRTWIQCVVLSDGASGWMSTKYLSNEGVVQDGTQTETFKDGRPTTQKNINIVQSRKQLFRIYKVVTDTEDGTVTAYAKHVYFDNAGILIAADLKYSDEDENPKNAQQVIWDIINNFHPAGIERFYIYDDALPKDVYITAEYSWKHLIEIISGVDDCIVNQTRCQLIRDNFDIYLIPDIPNDMGVTVRRGKNLIGVEITDDMSEIITSIIPRGKDAEGNDLFLQDTPGDGILVNSPRIYDYAMPHWEVRDYDVKVVEKAEDADGITKFADKASARGRMYYLAYGEYVVNRVDAPKFEMKVNFVLLQNAAGWEEYAALQSVHPYDMVTVIDELIGLEKKTRVIGYEWDAIAEQYNDVTLGDLFGQFDVWKQPTQQETGYRTGEIVIYNYRYWVCVTDHNRSVPSENNGWIGI